MQSVVCVCVCVCVCVHSGGESLAVVPMYSRDRDLAVVTKPDSPSPVDRLGYSCAIPTVCNC